MNSVEIAFSDDGTLINPALHDANLFGIISCPNRRMFILVRDVHGKIHCLAFFGVERFRADDFRQGNIILDITVQTGTNVSSEDLAYIFGIDVSTSDSYRENIMKKFNSGRLMLVQLDQSYGCSFLCACEGIEIVEDWINEVASNCS